MTKGTFEDFIGMWDNNVDEHTCKELVKYYDWSVKNSHYVQSNQQPANDREDEFSSIQAASPQYPAPLANHYWDRLHQCIDEYMKKYSIEVIGNLHNWIFKVHKVKEKQGYHVWHYENSSYETRDRFLAYMTYLQAPSEGGETEFLYQSKRIDPIVGRTLIWPAGFTHKHRGNPPLKGEKIYVTGWIHMCPFSPQRT